MADTLLEKMNKIEQLLLEINAKIDNFLGFEDLTEKEQEEIAQLRSFGHKSPVRGMRATLLGRGRLIHFCVSDDYSSSL